LIAAPNDFPTEAEAKARIAEVERAHRMTHHTWLDIVPYDGELHIALAAKGVLV